MAKSKRIELNVQSDFINSQFIKIESNDTKYAMTASNGFEIKALQKNVEAKTQPQVQQFSRYSIILILII